jgi:hypothetical protein
MTARWHGASREAFEYRNAAGLACACPQHREQDERRALEGLLSALNSRHSGRRGSRRF